MIGHKGYGSSKIGWAYQDFTAGVISTVNVTLTKNDNGTGIIFDAAKVISSSAVIVDKSDPDARVYTGTVRLLSTEIEVSAHTAAAVTLNGVPHITWGDVRIYYLYDFGAKLPEDFTLAPKMLRGTVVNELDNLFVSEEELSALNLDDLNDVTITAPSHSQVLQYDSATSEWINGAGGSGSYDKSGSYSTRFSYTLAAANLSDTLDELFVFTSVDPNVNLSLNPSSIREKGNTLASLTLTSMFTLGQNPSSTITSLEFFRAGATLSSVPNPTSPEVYAENNAVSDTTTFSVEIEDGEARTDTATATITFLYPLLYMVGAHSLTTAQIYAGGTKILSASENRTISYTTNSQTCYYAIPQTEGTFSSILDENSFETIGDWTRRDENITGLDTSAVAYYIYEFDNLTTQTDFEYTFS